MTNGNLDNTLYKFPVKFAGLYTKLGMLVIDFTILLSLFGIIDLLNIKALIDNNKYYAYAAIYIAYFLFFPVSKLMGTPAQYLCGYIIVNKEYEKITFYQSFLHFIESPFIFFIDACIWLIITDDDLKPNKLSETLTIKSNWSCLVIISKVVSKIRKSLTYIKNIKIRLFP